MDVFNNIGSTGMWIILTVARIIATIVIGMIAIKILLWLTKRALKKSDLDAVLYKFVINTMRVACIIILITMCLGYLGVQMSTIIAVIGAAGAAVALALKDSLANIAGGVMIIITQPFKRNDFVDVGEFSGLVKDIDLFITTLITYDNKTIMIPNGMINTSVLVNHTREGIRRVDCKFVVGHDADIERVKELMRGACAESPLIMDKPEPTIGVAENEESRVVMDLLAWCATEDYWNVRYILEEKINKLFREQGIDRPSQKVDIGGSGTDN